MRLADRVIVLETSGVIVLEASGVLEGGTHDELIRRGGVYAAMFRKQARGYAEQRHPRVANEGRSMV